MGGRGRESPVFVKIIDRKMLDLDKIRAVAEDNLAGGELFVVEVLIDSDGSVAIENCVALSRAINDRFDRDEEDYELTVASAGIGQPLKIFRQYSKLVGKSVEVVLKNGTKIIAELRDATPETITLVYPEQVAVEGKKRKETVERVKEYPLEEVKWTKEYLDFK